MLHDNCPSPRLLALPPCPNPQPHIHKGPAIELPAGNALGDCLADPLVHLPAGHHVPFSDSVEHQYRPLSRCYRAVDLLYDPLQRPGVGHDQGWHLQQIHLRRIGQYIATAPGGRVKPAHHIGIRLHLIIRPHRCMTARIGE